MNKLQQLYVDLYGPDALEWARDKTQNKEDALNKYLLIELSEAAVEDSRVKSELAFALSGDELPDNDTKPIYSI